MTPTLVLTRPEAQARAVAAALPGLPVVISPVIAIVATGAPVNLGRYSGAILTSANAAALAPDLTGTRIYCVGERTAEAAQARGGEVALVARDSDDLVARLKGAGPLVHLRGDHARGNVAKRLNSAGIETDEVIIYRQEPRPLSAAAKGLIEGEDAVVLPLYSPRSAALVAQSVARVGPEVTVLALSPAVAEAWGGPAEVCAEPSGAAMLRLIQAACGGESP